jgi:hypothetical protein
MHTRKIPRDFPYWGTGDILIDSIAPVALVSAEASSPFTKYTNNIRNIKNIKVK